MFIHSSASILNLMMPACRTNLDYINKGWIHLAEDTAL